MKRIITFFLVVFFILVVVSPALFASEGQMLKKIGNSEIMSYGFIGAGIAVGLSSIGAGIAVGLTGAAAIGALAEKPQLMGKLLLIVGLAEGIAIYGLLISIMIFGKI